MRNNRRRRFHCSHRPTMNPMEYDRRRLCYHMKITRKSLECKREQHHSTLRTLIRLTREIQELASQEQ